MFVVMKYRSSLKWVMSDQKLGHQVKMLEKACVRSGGQIFGQIIMKLGLTFCLDEISDEYKNGSCRVKTKSLGQILEKKLCML